MLDWPDHESSRFAYILCCIWNARNNLIFQHIISDPSRIILQAHGLWEEYIRFHYPIEEISASTDFTSGTLVNTVVPTPISLLKRKGYCRRTTRKYWTGMYTHTFELEGPMR